MSVFRVLVVDDEKDFYWLMNDILKEEGYVVTWAEDGLKALRMAAESHPDVILLDWNLPGKDGIEVCKALKADPLTKGIPILMLTARSRETDTVLGLEMGADDYISKRGLRSRELVARVRTALRKKSLGMDAGEVQSFRKLVVDNTRRRATMDGKMLDLRPKEFDLLRVFLERRGRVLSRSLLMETVWGEQFFGTSRTVDSTVARLRAKLGEMGVRLHFVSGAGYKFEDE